MRARTLPFLASLLLLVGLALPLRAIAADPDPAAFMTAVSHQVLQLIQDKQRPDAERAQEFQKLVDANFDLPKIARFVLGPSWRTATPDEQQQFTAVFRTYITQTYWSRFSQYYSGQDFTVTHQEAESSDIILVNSQIVQPSGPPIKVDWTLAKEGDNLKIIDVSISGISQVLTYRQEFASIIAQNDGHVSALIAQLNKKVSG
jgi:phospholipid transport system substrate-binding protein